jgi:Ca2+-binding RTX toxin-like protein
VTVDLPYGWLEKCEDFCYWFGPKIDEYCPTSSMGPRWSTTGDSSDNILLGGNGNDTLNGGAGNDILNGDAGNGILNGDADIDTASYIDAAAAVTVSLSTGTGTATGGGGAGSEPLIAIENVSGTNFADTITGSNFDDTITGNAGVNSLNGGDGNDFTSGELESDFISGNAGKDTLLGGADNDIDTFFFTSFSNSLLANFDVIGDFTSFDIIDRPGQFAASIHTSNGIAAGLLASQLSAILNNFSFTANSTRAFTATGFSGTFVAFNDGAAGFNEFSDSIVHLPSFNQGGTNTIAIA